MATIMTNWWRRFRDLLPDSPRLVGTVTTNHGDGTVTVSLQGGGTLRVRGTTTAGASVYVRDGAIEGAAPALPTYDVEI